MNTQHDYNILAEPVDLLEGIIEVPGDKSISHRSIMLGSIAEGTTNVENYLQGDDSLATLRAFQQMGVNANIYPDGQVTVAGVGLHGLQQPQDDLWLGNSGTAMRLMAGLLAGQTFQSRLTGDKSLSSRPMKRVTEPLTRMGASIGTDNGCAPLIITPTTGLNGIDYQLPVASAQVKSALLLAGLYADSPVSLTEPETSRNHSELMLQDFGVQLETDGNRVTLHPPEKLTAQHIMIPGDISSAAFFLVGGAISKHAHITINKVCINPTRIGVLHLLKMMGAELHIENVRQLGSEPVADIRMNSSQLKGINIPKHMVPLSIDEFPILFIAAACAEGTTRLTGAAELRVKESDRIKAMIEGLQKLGIHAQALDDGAIIEGGTITGGEVESYHDHRIAMAFTIASLAASTPILVRNCANINTSFPKFTQLANSIGLSLHPY